MIVLVVEDEPLIRWMVVDVLGTEGFDVREAKDGREARAAFAAGVDCVLLDIRLPDADGLDLLQEFRAGRPDTPVIMMTGHGTADVQRRARDRGCAAFLHKPFEITELTTLVHAVAAARAPTA